MTTRMPDRQPRRVAIACQGGGSHTAFTAGALGRLIDAPGVEVTGLSGTSGGGVCALLAWDALRSGGSDAAADALNAFWTDAAATSLAERTLNAWVLWACSLQQMSAIPSISPYHSPLAVTARRRFEELVRGAVDFDTIAADHDRALPMLLLGAVDVGSGDFVAFNSWRQRITTEMVLASAALPTLFRAVTVDERAHWDGLFAQNPPVRELLHTSPDEIWVIQINPRERDPLPRSVVEIADRRNELAGNLSLHQELYFIERLNQLVDDGHLQGGHDPVTIRIIELTRSPVSLALGAASKLNRDAGFITELVRFGERRADEFLAALRFEDAWRRRDAEAVVSCFDPDATLESESPFVDCGRVHGRDRIRPIVTERLAPDVDVDGTRTQVAGDTGVRWPVRTRRDGDGPAARGSADATFRDGSVTSLRITPDRADDDAREGVPGASRVVHDGAERDQETA